MLDRMTDRPEVTLDFENDRIGRRFGIDVLYASAATANTTMAMSLAGMRNPVTNERTVAPLAILVDMAGGIANHFRRAANQWTVTTELTLELTDDGVRLATEDPDAYIHCDARVVGDKGNTSLAICNLSSHGAPIGIGTVRSSFVSAERLVDQPDHVDPKQRASSKGALADLMAVRPVSPTDGVQVIRQLEDDVLQNLIGVFHGGVAAAGLELAASALTSQNGGPFATTSMFVNFLRPFMVGDGSRYVAVPLRIGRTSAVVDAQAVGPDGRTAITARLCGYR